MRVSMPWPSKPAKPKPIRATVLVACVLLERGGLGQIAFSNPAGVSREPARQIQEAGKRGDWKVVERLFSSCAGDSAKVYSAAVSAAYRCGHYEEAAEMYTRLRNLKSSKISCGLLVHGLKTFGRLHDKDMVDNIWLEILQRDWMSKKRAAVRLSAAAEMGDIVGAASVLDLMANRAIIPSCNDYGLAICACKNSNHSRRHEVAIYLFDTMIRKSIQPKAVTFLNLVGAHRTAPLHQIEDVLSKMSACRIIPNQDVTEAYVNALFEDRETLSKVSDKEAFIQLISQTSSQRQQAARRFLQDMTSQGIELSGPCSLALQYLQKQT